MVKIKLGNIGSREYNDYESFKTRIEELIKKNKLKVSHVVSGGAKEVDKMAEQWSKEKGFIFIEHLPDYKKYHLKKAPKERNNLIVKDADVIIAFWNGKSGGTKDAINKARKSEKVLIAVEI